MELINEIVEAKNFWEAWMSVRRNHGAAGIDKMTTEALDVYMPAHMEEIKTSIREKRYKPSPVRRVYIPKSNGKQRPLGIPTVVDRVVQQATAQVLSKLYEPLFSDHSYGFRPNRSCHKAMGKVLEYLNEGYEWVVDFDIEKYFDTVNHDKLISILREQVNDSATLHLIRSFLKAGVMENGLVHATAEGVPQGGCISPVLSNIYLDKLDKELESRGLRFVRYADDFDIFVKSEKSADRVMASVTSWLERKLRLKVSATKTKVVRPTKSNFLGFTFWKSTKGWGCKPTDKAKKKLEDKVKAILLRRRASAQPLSKVFTKLNQTIRGWVNYYHIGSMTKYLRDEFGPWMRHKVRVVIVKQWKRCGTIYRNLLTLKRILKSNLEDDVIYQAAMTRQGWYHQCGQKTISFLLSPKVLAMPKVDRTDKRKGRPGLVDPYALYQNLRTPICM
jgi:group II intron reverse transcriptase/maturase